MYICVTEVDAITKIICTSEPQRTGPSFPLIKNLKILWVDSSTWPVELASDGTYLRAPKYYGTCDDDADTGISGVLQILTEAEYTAAKTAEHEARRPYPSWIGYLDTMSWGPPVPIPANSSVTGGNITYQWDESTISWIENTFSVAP